MEAEDIICTEAGCTKIKECGNYCVVCYILNAESPPPDEQNSKETNDQLSKNKTLAPVGVAVNEQQVEQTARQVSRANENVFVSDANALPHDEYPKIFEQESTSVGSSNFGVCPASDDICESQSVAIQDQITDSTVESTGSVSRSEPEPSTSGYSGQKRKRKPNTDSADAKKHSRAKKRKANENQSKKRYREGVCQVCNDSKKHGSIYAHLKVHKNRAQQSKDQNEKNYTHKIENKNGVKTLVHVLKTDGQDEQTKKPGKMYECDICPHYSSFSRKDCLEDHIARNHFSKTIKCDYCPNLFATEKNLRQHISKCHAIKWECRVCNQKMTRNQKRNHKHPFKPNWKKI